MFAPILRRRFLSLLLACAGISAILAAGSETLQAQLVGDFLTPESRTVSGEHVTLHVGDVFEIQAVTDIPSPQFTWVLTRERAFVEAGRAAVFQVRLAEPGTYLLDAGVQNVELALQDRRTIYLDVLPRTVVGDEQRTENHPGLLGAQPPIVGDRVQLNAGTRVLRLAPKQDGAPKRFLVDLNALLDTDGDGVSDRDVDNAQTYAAYDGTPLHLWFGSEVAQRTIRVTLVAADGTEQSQTLLVATDGDGSSPTPPMGGAIATEALADGSVRFTLDFLGSAPPTLPVIYVWTFGDGFQSLVYRPVHRYGASGVHTVSVTVRNLENGQTILEASKDIEVVVKPTQSGAVVSSASSTPPPPSPAPAPSPGSGTGGRSWGRLFNIVLLGLACLIAAILLVWAVTRLLRRTGGLQKALEEAEAKIVPTKAGEGTGSDVIDVAKPLELKRTSPAPAEEEARPTEPEPPATAEDLTIDASAAPSWLMKGLEQEKPGAQSAAAAEESTPPPPSPPSDGATPSWLGGDASPVEPETPADAPTPPWLESVPASAAAVADEAPMVDAAPTPPEPVGPPASLAQEPEPQATPDPIPESTPDAPPTAPPIEPEPAIAEPEDAEPAQQSVEPEPEPVEPEPQPTPATTPESLAREDKERERRRLKRQRYRANLKKRREAEKAQAPVPAAAPSEPPPVIAAPVEPLLPAPAPQTTPTPQPQPIPGAAAPASDDDVAFLIRADSVKPPEEPDPDEKV